LFFSLKQNTYFNHTTQYKVSAIATVASFTARGRSGTEGGGGTTELWTAVEHYGK